MRQIPKAGGMRNQEEGMGVSQTIGDAALLGAAPELSTPLESEPVAWRVKDFADGWILCHTAEDARRLAKGAGNLVQPLYIAAAPQFIQPDYAPTPEQRAANLKRTGCGRGLTACHIGRASGPGEPFGWKCAECGL